MNIVRIFYKVLLCSNDENPMASLLINYKHSGWPQMVQWATNGPEPQTIPVVQGDSPICLQETFIQLWNLI